MRAIQAAAGMVAGEGIEMIFVRYMTWLMRVRMVCIFIPAFFTPLLSATVQSRETLWYDDCAYGVYGFRLSPELQKQVREFRYRKKTVVTVSNNWDGYYATLRVKRNVLVIESMLVDGCNEEEQAYIEEPFSWIDYPIECSWFTGNLVCENEYDDGYTVRIDFVFEEGELTRTRTERYRTERPRKRRHSPMTSGD